MPKIKDPQKKRDDAIKVEVNILRKHIAKFKEKLMEKKLADEKLADRERIQKERINRLEKEKMIKLIRGY